MTGERWNSSPEEWQQLIVQLLKLRYPLGEFVEIPDSVRGDCGLEGFSRDGIAYQCYAAEEPLTSAELTKRQKIKISRDLAKLETNSSVLEVLLGLTFLHRWVLVVPRWVDKDLLVHAEAKATQVRKIGLQFIAADFAPGFATLDDFHVEREKLAFTSAGSLRVEGEVLKDADVQDWVGEHDALIANLDRKALTICHDVERNARRLRDRFVRHYLEGRNALEKLKNQYPPLYEAVFRIKEDREHFLETQSLIPDSLPPEKIRATIENFRHEVKSTLRGISPFTVDQLVHEAVADWLLRCPLDFPREK